MVDAGDTHVDLLKVDVDVEVLLSLNAESLVSFAQPKVEAVVQVSPVQLVLSDTRVRRVLDYISFERLMQAVGNNSVYQGDCNPAPRLDVLSRFIIVTADVSIAGFRVCLLSNDCFAQPPSSYAKQVQMGDSIIDFLSAVSNFDLSFPQEEALSSAMQICIDRLAGLGIPLGAAWEISNTALLNFLEDVTNARQSTKIIDAESKASRELSYTMRRSANRTVASHTQLIQNTSSEEQLFAQDLLFDMPEGLSLSLMNLYYDSHLHLSIPSLFIANGEGIHLVRLTCATSESADDSRSQEGATNAEGSVFSPSVTHSSGPVNSVSRNSTAVSWHRFKVDRNYPFGRGGLALSVLGSTDDSGDGLEGLVEETIDDLVVGDLETLFSPRLYSDATLLLTNLLGYLGSFSSRTEATDISPSTTLDEQCHCLIECASASALLATEKLVPFTRIGLGNIVAKSGSMLRHREKIDSFINATEVELFNLAPDSEMYPELMSVLDGINYGDDSRRRKDRAPIRVCRKVTTGGTDEIEISLSRMRVIYLHRYITEVQQYLFSESQGVMRFFAPERHQQTSASDVVYRLVLENSSLVVPRASRSCDVVAVEIDTFSVENSREHASFSMPTARSTLKTNNTTLDEDMSDTCLSQTLVDRPGQMRPLLHALVSRLRVGIRNARVFTSLSESDQAVSSSEHPSFSFFYSMDGAARADKPVYVSSNSMEDGIVADDVAKRMKLQATRCWREVTNAPLSIDILADYAPHLRLLFASPKEVVVQPSLDFRLSQFCLLLSSWYSNMQELPCLFPYSADELKSMAVDPSSKVTFPEFGTAEMKSLLLNPLPFTCEICVVLERLSLRCSFDCFDEEGSLVGASPGLVVEAQSLVVHVTVDRHAVYRIGVGSSSLSFEEESFVFDKIVSVSSPAQHAWADLTFGLTEDIDLLNGALSQPFQMSAFMTSSWTTYHLGFHDASIAMADLNGIWKLLEFVSAYYSDEKHGHPGFPAFEMVEMLKVGLVGGDDAVHDSHGTDFRLWLTSPKLTVPCNPLDVSSPSVLIQGDQGLWYRYSYIGSSSLQECVSKGLSVRFCDGETIGTRAESSKLLAKGLSLGLRIDFNEESNHTDYSISMPFHEESSCSFVAGRVGNKPMCVETPTICSPRQKPHRFLGAHVCELTCIAEVLPSVFMALLRLSSETEESEETGSIDIEDDISSAGSVVSKVQQATSSIVASIGDVRCFLLDPVLGPHLPVAVVSVASIHVTASQFASHPPLDSTEALGSFPEDKQMSLKAHFWADYFKHGMTRSWEPLTEAQVVSVLLERSRLRGSGVSLNSDNPIHVNLSGAFLGICSQVYVVYQRLSETPTSANDDQVGKSNGSDCIDSVLDIVHGQSVVHKKANKMDERDRVAFSIKNSTGQECRIFCASAAPKGSICTSPTMTYIGHSESVVLSFRPSVSVIENLQIKEVTFPGIVAENEAVSSHVLDIQIPGYRWLHGLHVDTFGRSFAGLEPQSHAVCARAASDWMLDNLMKVVVEVGLENGGRQVAIRSLFSVLNKTDHHVDVLCHPDCSVLQGSTWTSVRDGVHNNVKDSTNLKPGGSTQVPVMLLLESLRKNGEDIGFVWVKPSHPSPKERATRSLFSTNPVDLSKLVTESARLFDVNRGQDIPSFRAMSGVQLSCPVVSESGDRSAPFCYVVEVGRSPIVGRRTEQTLAREKKRSYTHGPISYSLSLYAPFVVVNHLPKRGRFELMHALRRTVLWHAELDVGEQVSVHSVGLDAPLLLLVNLGYCRTPAGEGALVHHGTDSGNVEKGCLWHLC